jgi:hypothetical protein
VERGQARGDDDPVALGALPAAERVDAVLRRAAHATHAARAHLYLSGADPMRLRLERTHGEPDPGSLPADLTGGAAAAVLAPPLEVRLERRELPRLVDTPEGPFWSQPLTLGDVTVGALRVGPIAGGKLPRGADRMLAELAPVAALLVRAAGEADALRLRAEQVEARADAAKRVRLIALDPRRFVELLLPIAVRATNADGGFVAFVDERSLTLRLHAVHGIPESFDPGFLEVVGGTVLLRDPEAAARAEIASVVFAPLKKGHAGQGVLAMVDFGSGGMAATAQRVVDTLAGLARPALDHEDLFAEATTRYLDALRALACVLDVDRTDAVRHHERVAFVADEVARALGLPAAMRSALAAAASVHDAGLAALAGAPDGYLAESEHPLVAATLVDAVPLPAGTADAVAGHHEWFDGTGFPLGLRGAQMHPLARVLALAEFVVESANGDLRAQLAERRGSQLAPDTVDALVRLLDDGWTPEPRAAG